MGFFSGVGAVLLKIKGAVMATTTTKVATVAVAATVVVAGTVGAVQTEVFASPEKKVENALESLTENEESAWSALLGLRELFEAISKEGAEVGFDVKLEDVPLDELGLSGISLPNIGVGVTYRFDVKKEQTELAVGAKVAETTLLSANIYADKEKAMLSVPQLFTGYIGANYAESGFMEQLKNSELATMLGEEFTAVLEAFPESMEKSEHSEENVKMAVEYLAALKKSKDELFASMEASKDGEAAVLVNGEEVLCKVYKATFGPAEVEAYIHALIDETLAVYNEYMEENAESMGAAVTEELNMQMDQILLRVETFQEDLKGQITETTLHIYMKGKRLVMADVNFVLKEGTLNLNVLFGTEGNRYDNMHLTIDAIVAGETENLLELIHVTEDTQGTFSSEWTLIAQEDEVFGMAFSYEKTEGDFLFSVLLPTEEFMFNLNGVLTIPNKGRELAFELNKISFSEYGEEVSLGVKTEVYLKVFEGEISEPEEMKWDVVTMGTTEWNDITSEVTSNIYRLMMKLLFSN